MIGKPQVKLYSDMFENATTIRKIKYPRYIKFCKQLVQSIGHMDIHISHSNGKGIQLSVDVVELDVPLLVSLDFLDKYGLYVNNVQNILVCERESWSLPLPRKFGHIHLVWDHKAREESLTIFTRTELKRIHRHFCHPHAERIYKLLKRAEDPETTPKTLKELEKLTASCDICQRLSREPGCLRVSLPPDDIIFNRLVLMD